MNGPTSPPAIARLNAHLQRQIREATSTPAKGLGTVEAVTTTPAVSAAYGNARSITLALVRFDSESKLQVPVADVRSRPPHVGSRVELVVRRLTVATATAPVMYGLKVRVLHRPEHEQANYSTLTPAEDEADS